MAFTTVLLIVIHMYEHIESYFSDGKDFGVDIKYYVEEKPLGTVGGVKAIEAQLKEPFLVLYGDVLMDMDLSRLVAFHHNKNADATLVVHPNDHPYDSDLLAVDKRKSGDGLLCKTASRRFTLQKPSEWQQPTFLILSCLNIWKPG